MPWIDAFAPIQERNREIVFEDTWGHLAPVKNRRYTGNIFFTAGIFGDEELNPTTLRCTLVNKTLGELPSSPWFYDFLQDWYSAQIEAGLIQTGIVYEFAGYFLNYKFVGKLRPLYDFNEANPKYIS